ncbi:MAG TPA: hypothetical protein VGQ53_11060 [Chitinophagaceae bacterium]|jgi:hypothetical protein|nr:hypothetical protein [Chitinophagaceae bacterium]
MAEQEVIKHTKKIFGIWATKSNFLHKLSEFVGEIAIIVFAISLSIYFHDRSQLRHQRHETKEFLLGLKEDLTTDIEEMNSDKSSYQKSGTIFTYITTRKLNEPLNADTIHKYSNWIFNTTGLIPNSGRFEGFKSSGKIGTIENNELQNYIMDLYQENIPNLIVSTNDYSAKKQRLFGYLEANTKRATDSTTNLVSVLASDPAFNICRSLTFVSQILSHYDTCINKMKAIINDINKDYEK